jgi:transposase InsO family protein
MIVGWQASRSLHAKMALDAFEQAVRRRDDRLEGLVHHSDSQNTGGCERAA